MKTRDKEEAMDELYTELVMLQDKIDDAGVEKTDKEYSIELLDEEIEELEDQLHVLECRINRVEDGEYDNED